MCERGDRPVGVLATLKPTVWGCDCFVPVPRTAVAEFDAINLHCRVAALEIAEPVVIETNVGETGVGDGITCDHYRYAAGVCNCRAGVGSIRHHDDEMIASVILEGVRAFKGGRYD